MVKELWQKNLVFWIIGSVITVLGDFFFSTFIPVVTYRITQSSTFAAMVVFFDTLPAIILAPMVGFIVDRYDKKKIVIFSNIIAGSIVGLLCITEQNPWLYLATNSLISILALFYSTAAKTMLPLIITDRQLISRVNSLITFLLETATLVGTALAGIAIVYLPYKSMFAIDSISFLINAILVAQIVLRTRENIVDESCFFQSLTNTICFIGNNKPFQKGLIYYILFFFLRGFIYAQIVVFLLKELKLDNSSYALFENLIIIGVMIAHCIMIKFALGSKAIEKIKYYFAIIVLIVIVFAYTGTLYFMFVFGICRAYIINTWYTYFYTMTPVNLRGKLLNICVMFFETARLFGIGVAWITIQFISARNGFMIVSLCLGIGCIVYEVYTRRNVEAIF